MTPRRCTMKTWLRFFVWTCETLVVLVVVYFEPTYCVRGKLWGEAFFEGRPTSYWRAELAQWNVNKIFVADLVVIEPTLPNNLDVTSLGLPINREVTFEV